MITVFNFPPTILYGIAWIGLTLSLTLYGELKQNTVLPLIFKPLASFGFIGIAWMGELSLSSGYGLALICAFILSTVGDIVLIRQDNLGLALGLSAFLLAHVAYIWAGLTDDFYPLDWTFQSGIRLSVLLVSFLLIGRMIYLFFKEDIPPKLQIPSLTYIMVIGLMMTSILECAWQNQNMLMAGGALCFWCSDISVAHARFKKAGFLNRLWGLPLYYLAQILFALTLYPSLKNVS